MISTLNKPVKALEKKANKSLMNEILESLGLEPEKDVPGKPKQTFKIEFEQHFSLEISENSESNQCRASARICSLGKSLSSQETQIAKALTLFTEVITEAPRGTSLSVSDHDSCLRMVKEFLPNRTENTPKEFEKFLNFSFVFKKTFLNRNW